MSVRDLLQKFTPLNTLSDPALDEVIASYKVDHTETNEVLFNEGENDGYAVYLLQGEAAVPWLPYSSVKRRINGAYLDPSEYSLNGHRRV